MADDVVRDIPEEMVEKATFWNERVGRVDPTREGQPLRWWYGPLKASSDPTQKWCDDCYGVIEEGNGRRWCRLCKASQPLFDEVIEQRADEVTRELAPTLVRYPVGISSVPALRAVIGQVLSAALVGRAVVDLPAPDDTTDRLGGTAEWSVPGGVIGVYPNDARVYAETRGGYMTGADAELEGAALIAAARSPGRPNAPRNTS